MKFSTTLALHPTDTLFFRDGRPFNDGEGGNLEAVGSFPPHPSTVVGALRAAMAQANGWVPSRSSWDERFKSVLGDGQNLESLCFRGPFVRHAEHLVFPAPRALMGVFEPHLRQSRLSRVVRLHPGPEMRNDLGNTALPIFHRASKDVSLPQANEPLPKELEGYWITQNGLQRFLRGEAPEPSDLLPSKDLYASEARVGIKRTNRITLDNALYQTAHVRTARHVSIEMQLSGFPNDWKLPRTHVSLGGEGRFVWLETHQDQTVLPLAPAFTGTELLRYTVTLLTPLEMHHPNLHWRQVNQRLHPQLPGTVVSACVGKPIWIGGWDSIKNQPLDLQPHLPAGSTWFIEATNTPADNVQAQHLTSISQRSAWGYGLIAIGVWHEGGHA